MNRCSRLILLVAALLVSVVPGWAGIVVQHVGATNPATEGWSYYAGSVGAVTDAWHIEGAWDSSQYNYHFSGTELTGLTGSDWVLSATMSNLSTRTDATWCGTLVSILFAGVRIDMNVRADGLGNQVLTPNAFDAGNAYTIQGLGQGYALVQIAYSATTGKADLYVNGTRVIASVTPYSSPFGNQIAFGGENSNFRLVKLEANTRMPPVFTDDPLVAGTSTVKAVHFTELRTAVAALRARYALTAVSWTDDPLISGAAPVRAVHVMELRAALRDVYTTAGRTAPTYTDSVLVAGHSIITVAHVTELRSAVLGVW
jgi:hypothetical protein